MYFKISDANKLKWDGNDDNWYKPVVEGFSFGGTSESSSSLSFIILIALIILVFALYFLYKKTYK